jgi:hypothetical protein
MADEISLVRSEVLCFVQNNISCTPKANLVTCLCGFYSCEDIVQAKDVLFNVASDLDRVVDLPRNRTRRGDSKQRADVDDLFELWAVLDLAKAKLPTFVAADLRRLPPLSMTNADVCALSVSVMEIRSQLVAMSTAQSKLADNLEKAVQGQANSLASRPARKSTEGSSMSSPAKDPPFSPSTSRPWSEIAAVTAVSDNDPPNVDGFTTVSRKKRQPDMPRIRPMIRGNKAVSGDKLRPVPRRIAAFVGRLHVDTTEDDLLSFLKDAKIVNPFCRKLVAKDGKQFKTAAFMVSCDICSSEQFFSESTWPDGCELRDWVYRVKSM